MKEIDSALLMQRATASRALQSYIFLRDMEQEGRSKVTVSDEDTEPLIELTAALQKSTTGYGNGRAD